MTLSLVDMALVGKLLVMLILSSYENFVSAIDLEEGQEKLSWPGKLDVGSLKQKVAASIVAISSSQHAAKTCRQEETTANLAGSPAVLP